MTDTTPTPTRAVCATCGRDFAIRKNPNVRSHNRPHTDQPWRVVACEGAGQPPARTFPTNAPIRAEALREAAALIEADDTCHKPAHREHYAHLLRTKANEIHPT